jgi:membrane associated rhomboid family serine protease/tetratricopeptide (TPR) repeat protein
VSSAQNSDEPEESAAGPDPLKVLEGYYRERSYMTTKLLIAVNCLVFAAMVVATKGAAFVYAGRQTVVEWGACAPSLALNEEPWRILTSAFVHVGVLHLIVNMFVLWDVGRYVERLGGTVRFLTIYIFCALAASLFSLLAHPYQVSAGASGAVLGLWGAFLSFFINNQNTLPKRLVISTMRFVPVFVFIAVVTGTFIPDVDNAAHAGGFVIGMFCGVFLLRSPTRPVPLAITASSLLATAGVLFTLYRVDQMRPFDFDHKYEYERARDLIERHDSKRALSMLNKHIASNPGAVEGYVMRAHVNERMENWGDAEKDASKILELGGPKAIAYSLRAQARLARGDYPGAVEDADAAIQMAPSVVPPYMVRVRAKERLEKYDEALADAQTTRAPALSETALHRLRGEVYWGLGDNQKAVFEFDQAVKQDPSSDLALASRSLFLFSQGDYRQSAIDADKVLSIIGYNDPHVAYNAISAAIAHRGAGDETRAIEIMKQVEKHVSDEWQQKLVAFIAGDLSADELLKAARDSDQRTEANTYVAVAYLQEGKEAQARELLEWVLNNGNRSYVEYPLARALLRGIKANLLKKKMKKTGAQ